MKDKMNNSDSSSNSLSSDVEKVLVKNKKRYKRALYPNFNPLEVKKRTLKKWQLMQPSSSCKVPLSTTVAMEHETQSGSLDEFENAIQSSVNFDCDCNSDNDDDSNMHKDDEFVSHRSPNKKKLEKQENKTFINTSDSDVTINTKQPPTTDDELIAAKGINFSSENDNYCSSSQSLDDDELNDDEDRNSDPNLFARVIFEASNMTIRSVLFIITAFSLRFKLSDTAKLELANIIKLLAGPHVSDVNFSKYMMSKCFSSQEENIIYHYYCDKCENTVTYSAKANEKIKRYSGICEKCYEVNIVTCSSPNYFISINLKYQLQQLLSDNVIFHDIINNNALLKRNNVNIMKCVENGDLYRKINSTVKLSNDNEIILNLNFNTDGAPLSKSGKRGFWPVQVIVNNLTGKFRFAYVLLSGILIVANEPKSKLLNLYFTKVFLDQIDLLYKSGITFVKNNMKYLFRICPLNCPVDSVCRPIIQNRLQFNGYWGCSWCYQKGKFVHSVNGIRYPNEQDAPLRSNESHRVDVQKATEFGVIINGVRGMSCFQDLPFFDLVWSFPYEYMHGTLLGVVHQIWNEWKNGKHNPEYKLKSRDIKFIESRFLTITPTHDIHRLPRKGIILGTAKPKASELKSWLLFYSLPCLNGILNEKAMQHYTLLVSSIYTLLKEEISEEELIQVEKNLIIFVCGYEDLYGEESMTFNIHSLLHIVDSVRQSGPIFTNSAFPYESYIYKLKNFITGTNGMDRQMARKHLQTLLFKCCNMTSTTLPREIVHYAHNLFLPKRLESCTKNSNVTFFGKAFINTLENNRVAYTYKKCIFKGCVYHSIHYYSRVSKTDDTLVQLTNGKFGRILEILKINDQCQFSLALIKMFDSFPFENVSHIWKIEGEEESSSMLISIEDVKQKVLLVNVRSGRYICTLPNKIEIQ